MAPHAAKRHDRHRGPARLIPKWTSMVLLSAMSVATQRDEYGKRRGVRRYENRRVIPTCRNQGDSASDPNQMAVDSAICSRFQRFR